MSERKNKTMPKMCDDEKNCRWREEAYEPAQALSSPIGSSTRKAFEDWCEAEHMPFEVSTRFDVDEDGDYKLYRTAVEWGAWQAALKWQNVEVSPSEARTN